MARKRTVIGIAVLIGAAIAVPATAALAYGRETTSPPSPTSQETAPAPAAASVTGRAEPEPAPPRPAKTTVAGPAVTWTRDGSDSAPPPGPIPPEKVKHQAPNTAPRAEPGSSPYDGQTPPTDLPPLVPDPVDN
ncbi:MAG: hypothetical protein QOE51_489 [Actinoplanes sp.]|jgi:hypothetical protein|nr:hypothetical protein [Actinoplanes sp.]